MREDAEYPSPEVETAVTCAMFNALFWRRPQYDLIAPWAKKVRALLESTPELTLQLATTGVTLVNHDFYVGEVGKAEQTLRSVGHLLRRSPQFPFAQFAFYQGEAAMAVVLGDAAQCAHFVSLGLDLARTSGVALWNVPLLGAGCLGALMVGDLSTAQQRVDRMLAQLREGALFFQSWTLSLQAAGGLCARRPPASQASRRRGVGVEYAGRAVPGSHESFRTGGA